MPAGIDDLENGYTGTEVTNVATNDDIYTDQTATGQYAIHQFKDTTTASTVTLNLIGKSTLAPSTSAVYLQIYNRDTTLWETIDSDSATSADTEFTLTAEILDLTNYKDANGTIVCRAYQNG